MGTTNTWKGGEAEDRGWDWRITEVTVIGFFASRIILR